MPRCGRVFRLGQWVGRESEKRHDFETVKEPTPTVSNTSGGKSERGSLHVTQFRKERLFCQDISWHLMKSRTVCQVEALFSLGSVPRGTTSQLHLAWDKEASLGTARSACLGFSAQDIWGTGKTFVGTSLIIFTHESAIFLRYILRRLRKWRGRNS